MYDVQTYRYLLILHHDKLKLRWACEQPKWILDYQARLRVITEPTGKEPKQAQPEKNDKRGEGSVVPKTDNPINAPEPDSVCIGTIALAPENKRRRYECCICKTGHPVSLMVQFHQCKDWFHPT